MSDKKGFIVTDIPELDWSEQEYGRIKEQTFEEIV